MSVKRTKMITVTLSGQSADLLRQLQEFGIYGVTIEDVAARLVDGKLAEMWGDRMERLQWPGTQKEKP